MTASYIDRPVLFAAERGVVTAQGAPSGKRQKVLLDVRLDGGREIKIDLRHIQFADEPVFAEPAGHVDMRRVARRQSYNREV